MNYFEHCFTFVTAISECVSVSAFALIVYVPVGFASSAVGIKVCEITVRIKKCKSVVKQKRQNHDLWKLKFWKN